MVQAPETTEIRLIGPYDGPRISGTSESVDAVIIVRLYHMGAYSVRVTHIPAKRDNATGRLYVTASVAKQIQRKVREIGDAIARAQEIVGDVAIQTHLDFSISAREFLSDTA